MPISQKNWTFASQQDLCVLNKTGMRIINNCIENVLTDVSPEVKELLDLLSTVVTISRRIVKFL